jgi:LPXTG-motif cell wall-anchored protein
MGDFIGSIPFFILLGVILIALIGLFFYLRKKEED